MRAVMFPVNIHGLQAQSTLLLHKKFYSTGNSDRPKMVKKAQFCIKHVHFWDYKFIVCFLNLQA